MRVQLYTDEPYLEMKRLFKSELERQHERSEVTLEEKDGKTTFTITAQDISALRAAFNSITSILRIWEDSK